MLISPTASDVTKLIGLYDALVTADANDQAAVCTDMIAETFVANGLDIRACAGRVQCVSS